MKYSDLWSPGLRNVFEKFVKPSKPLLRYTYSPLLTFSSIFLVLNVIVFKYSLFDLPLDLELYV